MQKCQAYNSFDIENKFLNPIGYGVKITLDMNPIYRQMDRPYNKISPKTDKQIEIRQEV